MGHRPEDDSRMTPEQAFGRVLRAVREERHLSQEYLALESGYSREYISMLERGRKSPSLGAVFRLAQVLAVPPSELVRRTEAVQPTISERRQN